MSLCALLRAQHALTTHVVLCGLGHTGSLTIISLGTAWWVQIKSRNKSHFWSPIHIRFTDSSQPGTMKSGCRPRAPTLAQEFFCPVELCFLMEFCPLPSVLHHLLTVYSTLGLGFLKFCIHALSHLILTQTLKAWKRSSWLGHAAWL